MASTPSTGGSSGTSGSSTKGKTKPSIFKPPKDFKPVPVKLDNIESLTGKDNYEDWADTIKMIMRGMGCKELVVDGLEPADDATDEEVELFKAMENQAILMLIQVISKPILKVVSKLDSPHAIWKHLKAQYYRDTPFSFVHQLRTLFDLASTYTPSTSFAGFIEQYETEWTRLYSLTSSTDEYRKSLRSFLDKDEAKRDILLSFLVTHHSNIVDNLSTKSDLTYADAKLRLLSIGFEVQKQDTALSASFKKKGKPQHQQAQQQASGSDVECTYCKKNGSKYTGHTWQKCQKLKKANEDKKQNKKKEEKKEQALIVGSSGSSKDEALSDTSRTFERITEL